MEEAKAIAEAGYKQVLEDGDRTALLSRRSVPYHGDVLEPLA
jgi:hypothetical protein